MTTISFTVYGDAKPAGSKKAFINPKTGKAIVSDSSGAKGKAWRQDVKDAAREAMNGQEPFTGPLSMQLVFYRQRPKGHASKSKNGGLLPSAPMWPATRPDTTKLVRAVEDALTGTVYRDDAQIVEQTARKRYGESRVVVEIAPVAPESCKEASTLPVTGKAGIVGHVLIDPDDYPELSQFSWCLNKGYAIRGTLRNRIARQIPMHRQIMGVLKQSDIHVDHINGDPLDNRRANLRLVSHAENSQNVRVRSGFRGVTWHKRAKKWVAQAKYGKRPKYLGLFEDPVEAAKTAEAWRQEHMPYAEPDPALQRALVTGELPEGMDREDPALPPVDLGLTEE